MKLDAAQRVSEKNSPSILISLNEHLASQHCDENCVANIFSYHIHSKHCETPSCRSVSICFRAGELLRNIAGFRPEHKPQVRINYKVMFSSFIYLFIMCVAGCFFLKYKHESIVHLVCQFMHILCIFRTRRGAAFFRQFVSGSGSFQVQQKVSWELLEKREKARMKRGWAELLHPW